jgi:hypothetical protein
MDGAVRTLTIRAIPPSLLMAPQARKMRELYRGRSLQVVVVESQTQLIKYEQLSLQSLGMGRMVGTRMAISYSPVDGDQNMCRLCF